ncbi:MAG: exo-alpha-sialidase [Firmicutes bacterium]|nr:exo-alpha-sialidase [Bacillota bacterium]
MFRERTLFKAGVGAYAAYRIPSLLTTDSGTILAFCEGRRHSVSDAGDIDILMTRSLDSGVTWEQPRVIVSGKGNTVSNPCPVQDRSTGRIFLHLNWNQGEGGEGLILEGKAPRRVLLTTSDDEGENWSAPEDLTHQLKGEDWTWYANGPGHGIQLSSGRLVIPCNHAVLQPQKGESGPYQSHVVYSDDHGKTWKLGGILDAYTNECQVVELADGSVHINMRSYHGKNCRAIANSHDGGLTWSAVELDPVLVDPVCQASILRYSLESDGGKSRILFANAASAMREKLTVRISYDECQTWNGGKCLYSGPSAYSDLAKASDGTILCFYERGEEGPYEELRLAQFSLDWLTDDTDRL